MCVCVSVCVCVCVRYSSLLKEWENIFTGGKTIYQQSLVNHR